MPRAQIHWNPSIVEDACIGCGTCVTGCSRLVYRFDFERKKPVVVDPLNCMVGCPTCANTCPAHAIDFPPIGSVLALEGLAQVRHAVEDDLLARHDILAAPAALPHPDRMITLEVAAIERLSPEVLKLKLVPVTPGECFCEFTPGQYIELWQPGSTQLSRSYSIAHAPQGDGSIAPHIRRVDGGRFTAWAFGDMKVGVRLQARGPLGAFTTYVRNRHRARRSGPRPGAVRRARPLHCRAAGHAARPVAGARCAGRGQPAAAHRFLRCLMRGRWNTGLRRGGPAGSQNDQRAWASGREGISAG